MSLPGLLVCGVCSAAGGGVLTALVAASFASNLPFSFVIVTAGALAGSIAGWFVLKPQKRLFGTRGTAVQTAPPSDKL